MSNTINGYAKVVFPSTEMKGAKKEYTYLIPNYITVNELLKKKPDWVIVPNKIAEFPPYAFGRLIGVSEIPYPNSEVQPHSFIVSYIDKEQIKKFNDNLQEKKRLLEMIDKCHAMLDKIPEKFDMIDNPKEKEDVLKLFEMYMKGIM